MRNIHSVLGTLLLSLAALFFVAASRTTLRAEEAAGSGSKPADSCPQNLARAIHGLKLCRAELSRCEARACPQPIDPGGGEGGGLTHMKAMKALFESADKLDVDEAAKLSLLSASVLDAKARVLPKEKLAPLTKALVQARDALKQADAVVVKRKSEAAQ